MPRIGPREADGHVDLQVFVVQILLWVAYAVWALVVPLLSRPEGSTPVVPLVVLAGAAGLFLFRDRFSIDLLVLNSSLAVVIVPALFVLNLYRAVNGRLPAAWAEGPWHAGATTFLGFQALAVILAALYVRRTARAWREEPGERRRRLRNRLLILAGLLFAALAAVLSFVALH